MNKLIANWIVLALIVELVLLSIQAEPVTAFFGYLMASLMGLALIIAVIKREE